MPLRSIDEDPDLQAIERECVAKSEEIKELKSLGASTIATDGELRICSERWNGERARLLVTTYWAADLDWILKVIKIDSEGIQLESLFVYSHNLRVKAYIAKQLAGLKVARRAARRELEDARELSIQQAALERDIEIAEKQRRFAMVMSAFAQGMANAQQAQRPQHPSVWSSTTSPSSTKGCSSDFDCGIGFRCVKANFSMAGYCAKAVNEYGVQTFDMPDMDSVLVKVPKGSDCKFITDCPIGFTCEVESGACMR